MSMKSWKSSKPTVTVSIAQELTIAQKTVWNHAGYKKKLDVWVLHKIDPLLKRMGTGDEKWITYDYVNRKQSWSNHDKPAQTVARPGMTAKKVLLCLGGLAQNYLICTAPLRSNS